MVQLSGPQFAEELLYQRSRLLEVFVAGHRRKKVAGVGQAVAANLPQVRQTQRGAVVLGDVTACLRIQQLDTELETTGQHDNFQRLDIQHAQVGGDAQAALLGDDQQFAVGIEEHALH